MAGRPLELVLVTRRYPPLLGGAEKVLSYLARALAVQGANVTVITSRIPGMGLAMREDVTITTPTRADGQAVVKPGQLSVIRLNTSRLRFWGTWRYMHNLKRWLQKNPVDLAYVSMLKHDAYVTVGVGRHCGFPVILRPEGAGPTGDLAWQSWGNFGRMIGLRCRRANAFVAISKSIDTELHKSWQTGTLRSPRTIDGNERATSPRIIAIPNGVPVPEIAWKCRVNWQAEPRAVFIGRLAHEKGLDTLINAWPRVRACYPSARLILIGEGPQQASLISQARAHSLTVGPGQAVELVGGLADPSRALRDADLFILPSREEGMSIALLEAMALGIPLVASAIPGNCQLVNDFEHGRLAPPDDAEGLARIIVDQWSHLELAMELSRAARSRIVQEFSIEVVARKHLEVFQEIMHRRAVDSRHQIHSRQ
jgi:glycosyltransferase involved in cell wall biosynthesis